VHSVANFRQLVKAYDIRGTVPDQMNAGVARDVGMLFAAMTEAPLIAVAHDMRESSPELAEAFAEGWAAPITPTTCPARWTSRPR
jgi:phosphomannomutase